MSTIQYGPVQYSMTAVHKAIRSLLFIVGFVQIMDAWWWQRWLNNWCRKWIETRLVRTMKWICKLIPQTTWRTSKYGICDYQWGAAGGRETVTTDEEWVLLRDQMV